MSKITRTINFPEGLASKILWSPNVDEDSGRSSRSSYVLVAPNSHSHMTSPSVEDLAPENKGESITETKVFDVSDEPVPPIADVSSVVLDGATEPTIDVVSANDSSSNEKEAPSQHQHIIPKLPDSIQEEMKTLISYKFSVDIQIDMVKAHKDFHTEKKQIVEPVVHFYCPHSGCNEVIDEAVRDIAKHEGAEILTLDALELSSAETGILGDQIHGALSALYKDPDEEAQKKKDLELQAIFNALISLPSSQGVKDTAASAKKRIIYIRDFGSIAKVSSPLIVRLLRAIHARRVAKFSDDIESDDDIQPTLLFLGYSNPISISTIGESVFVRGSDALRAALPRIGTETLQDNLTSITLNPIASQFFLSSLVAKGEDLKDVSDNNDDDDDDDGLFSMLFRMPKSMRNRLPTPTPTAPSSVRVSRCTAFNGPLFSLSSFDLSSASLAMSVFLKGEEKKAFASLEEGLCDRRKSDVANAWFKVSLTQRKRRLACDDIVSLLENDEDLQKDLAVDKEGGRKNEEKNRLMPTLSSQKNSKRDSEKEHQGPYKGLALLARLAELANSSISVALDKGVAIILGLSNSGQTSGSVDVPEVPLSAFTKAFRMLIHAHKSRAEWWKKESEQNVDDNVNVANTGNAGNEKAPEEDPVVKSVKNATDLTGYESALLSCIVDPNELATAFEDVCISEKTVDTLRTITSLRLRFPSAFTSGVLSRESMGGVLLYGPPGTGKTMVCRAVARESGARMLVIKPSDVMDKCLGESEKRVKAIFGLAYRLAPCLIFVDELDSLFGKRKEDDQKWYRDILAEFLQSMDGLKSAKENTDAVVILIGATNRPQDIDEAVIRRLPSRMMVDAPDEKQRQRILELHLRGETLDEDVKLSEIAAKTTNYSGSDLKNVCVSAAMASVKEAIGIFTWEPIKSKDVPKAGDDSTPGGAQGDEETKKSNEKIDKRTVKMCHLMAALAEVSGSLSNSSTGQSELQRWHSQFGAGASSRPSYVAGHTRPGGYSGAGSYGSKPGGYTGAGNYGSGGNATGAGGYGSGGAATGAGGYGLGGIASGAGGYASKYGAGSGTGFGAGGSGIFGSGAGGGYGQPSGEANGNVAGAASNANVNSSSPFNIPRYGGYPGAGLGVGAGGYGSNFNAASSGAEPNDNSSIPGGNGATSGLPRYGGTFGRYGGGNGGGGIGGGIGNMGPGGFGAGGPGIGGIGSTGGALGGLGSIHGIGGIGSAGDNRQGPYASIEPVDEQGY